MAWSVWPVPHAGAADLGVVDHAEDCDEGVMQTLVDRIVLPIYIAVTLLAAVTLLVRVIAARLARLPLRPSNRNFLLAALLLTALRLCSLCPDVFGLSPICSRRWHWTLIAMGCNTLFTTMFAVLIYHTIKVLHSVELAFEPILSLASRIVPSEDSSHLHRSCNCRPKRCPFWVVLGGRPFSVFKWMLCAPITAMWAVFLFLLARQVFRQKIIVFDDLQPENEFLDCLTFVIAAILAAFFSMSGIVLLCRVRELRCVQPSLPHIASIEADLRVSQSRISQCLSAQNIDGRPSVSTFLLNSLPTSNEQSVFNASCVTNSNTTNPASYKATSGEPSSLNSRPENRNSTLAGIESEGRANSHSTIQHLQTLSWDLAGLDSIIIGMRRMLIVVTVCTFTFLLRASLTLGVDRLGDVVWLPALLLIYFTIGEALPLSVMLLLYLVPGLKEICRVQGDIDSATILA